MGVERQLTITLEVSAMTINYPDGRVAEGIILSRTENTMRVALKDGDDTEIFTCVEGTWISEDCEPVEIRFAWQRHFPKGPVSEADCICSKELAARLIHVLLSGDEDECGADLPVVQFQTEHPVHHQ